MSEPEKSVVVASPISLVKKAVTRLNFDGIPREGASGNASGDINLSISVGKANDLDDGRHSLEATLLVRGKPASDVPFYIFDAEVRGIYDVGEAQGTDEETKAFIERRGMEELYDYFKFVMTVLTAEGSYGQIQLPTIAVARID